MWVILHFWAQSAVCHLKEISGLVPNVKRATWRELRTRVQQCKVWLQYRSILVFWCGQFTRYIPDTCGLEVWCLYHLTAKNNQWIWACHAPLFYNTRNSAWYAFVYTKLGFKFNVTYDHLWKITHPQMDGMLFSVVYRQIAEESLLVIMSELNV